MERIETFISDIKGVLVCQGDLVKLSYGDFTALVTVLSKKDYEIEFRQKVITENPLQDNYPMPVITYKIKSGITGKSKIYVRGLTGKFKIVGRIN